jgi:glycosyltransferase involved in cell wall biosynthesis
VAITVWRREELLTHAVQSVLSQTYARWEIRIYSDGRSSASARVARELSAAGVPIHYQRLPRRPRKRGNHLRRLALEQALGSHVVILGHDCLLLPTCLESHAATIDGDPDVLSVVPIAYWKHWERRPPYPRHEDLMSLEVGQVDLLCMAFPKRLALEADCFGRDMVNLRPADFLSFAALRRLTVPRLFRGPEQAAHF